MQSTDQTLRGSFKQQCQVPEIGSSTPDSRSNDSKPEAALSIQPLMNVDGGSRAWVTICGCWLTLFSTLGYLYSFGVYQDYYTRIFLIGHSPSSISWMGSFQLAMPFACAIMSGKLFDAGYFHHTMIAGSALYVFSIFMLSLAHPGHYYQVFLTQALGMGLGAGFVYPPATIVINLHFVKRRAFAYGVALTGVSIGAVVFPIMLNHLIPRVGFANAVRASGYVCLAALGLGNCLMRLPHGRKPTKRARPEIKKLLKNPAYIAFAIGTLLSIAGFYFPIVFLQLYAVEHQIDGQLAFYSLAIMNASGILGRITGNYLADIYGIWMVHIPTTLCTGATIWAIQGINSKASLIAVAILYGIFSGAWLSLLMVAMASLASSPEDIGVQVGISLAIGSIFLLVSAPIQGALLTSSFIWIRPIAFSGSMMFAGAAAYMLTRLLSSTKIHTRGHM